MNEDDVKQELYRLRINLALARDAVLLAIGQDLLADREAEFRENQVKYARINDLLEELGPA